MDWRTPLQAAWESIKEFFAYSGKVQGRAIRDTWEYMGKHYLSWETTLAMSGAIWLAVTGPWSDMEERLIAGALAGLSVLAVSILLQYVLRLLVAPTLIHRDQENELAQYSPKPPVEAPKGVIDFEVDVAENVTLGRMTRLTVNLGNESERIGNQVGRLSPRIQPGNPPRVRLRSARYLARKMMASARRIRRIHARLVRVSAEFKETWMRYTPLVLSQAEEEQKAVLYDAITTAYNGVSKFRDSVSSLRSTFQGDTRMLQQSIWTACEISDGVYKNLEDTLSDIAKSLKTIMAPLDKPPVAGRASKKGSKESRGRGKKRAR